MSAFSINSFNSWFILILHDPSLSCTGPRIFLSILRSNILRCCSSLVVSVQASHPYSGKHSLHFKSRNC